MSDKQAGREILGALLWARNHLDNGANLHIVKRLDAVLDKHEISIADMCAFREAFPFPPLSVKPRA